MNIQSMSNTRKMNINSMNIQSIKGILRIVLLNYLSLPNLNIQDIRETYKMIS